MEVEMNFLKMFVSILFGLLILGQPLLAQEKKMQVVCTLPTLKALTEEVGGNRVDVIALARGDQDPHFVTPTPVLMQKTRQAELFIQVGLSLELWADQVANGSGNQESSVVLGACHCKQRNFTVGVPAVVSREFGDIHPQGNPHVWLDPLLAKVQAGISLKR
jgi:zinc/manganese transport system substrate-binding protein